MVHGWFYLLIKQQFGNCTYLRSQFESKNLIKNTLFVCSKKRKTNLMCSLNLTVAALCIMILTLLTNCSQSLSLIPNDLWVISPWIGITFFLASGSCSCNFLNNWKKITRNKHFNQYIKECTNFEKKKKKLLGLCWIFMFQRLWSCKRNWTTLKLKNSNFSWVKEIFWTWTFDS